MEETNELSVQLHQFPHSPFCQSVAIALAEKGVPFSVVNDDMRNRSQLLLEANPVHKKVPVLFHNGRSIVESCVIVEYIEDTWPDRYSLFLDTAFGKAQARFWVDLIEVRIGEIVQKIVQCRDSEIDKAAFEEGMLLLNRPSLSLEVKKGLFSSVRASDMWTSCSRPSCPGFRASTST